MKLFRRLLPVILVIVCLSGCFNKSNITDAQYELYQSYYKAVLDNTDFISSSKYYSTSLEMTKMKDGTYRYYVFIDEAQVAMHDISAIVVEDETPFDNIQKMVPTIGVFDNKVTMIPNQVNTAGGFVKGIALSGEYDKEPVTLKIMIQWYDRTHARTTREFLTYTLSTDGVEKKK